MMQESTVDFINALLHRAGRYLRIGARTVRYFRPLDKDKGEALKLSVLRDIYVVTNDYLKQLDVEYWLALGTLLGYHRENDIIAHDMDIDFGAHEKEYEKILGARDSLPEGFTLYDTSLDHRGPKLYIEHRGWEADIYFYEDSNDVLRSYVECPDGGESKPFPKSMIYPLQKAVFLGQDTLVPYQTAAFLEHIYGYTGADAVRDSRTGYWSKTGNNQS